MSKAAGSPPMGWNSWDCYGASVTEQEVRGNARFMADRLRPHGWEYVIVDIQWYEPTADSSRYHPFAPLEMDAFSRLMPAVNRFPSAAGGVGFRPLADDIHAMGLKFGIHIMRGIPRQAVHRNTPLAGTSARARDIAHPCSICAWNTDMYGVDTSRPGAQAYYDSLFALYASWGVDFVKVDDAAYNFIAPGHYCGGEIEAIAQAIRHSGRRMVLSLSPGPAPLEKAGHLARHADMWRITDDLWDTWDELAAAFDVCAGWSARPTPGRWPDADMLPLGHIGIRSCEHGAGDRTTRLTPDEQRTMLSLWCLFRSPLFFGGEMRGMDRWTLSLLTNDDVLRIQRTSHGGRPLPGRGDLKLWTAQGDGCRYLGLFNLGATGLRPSLPEEFRPAGTPIGTPAGAVFDLWSHTPVDTSGGLEIPPHGVRLLRLSNF